jgi:VWFA-related protein
MKQWLAAACVLGLAASVAAHRQKPSPASADLVEVDVVVLDRDDHPITDLRQDEFRIKEDGHAVDVKTFAAIKALGTTEPDDARSVVLLMDDIGVPITGTAPMQQIAPVMLSPIGRGDDVSVVRLSSRTDEPFGDLRTARDRIDGYRGGVQPFSFRDTPDTVLKMVARIARQLEPIDHRRKVILCLGLPAVCDVPEPTFRASGSVLQEWISAVAAAAHANAALYCVDPTGARGGLNVSGSGLVNATGGRVFAHENSFPPFADAIWREAGHYYLLGYWPQASTRELHAIDVSVTRKGARVHARKQR